jgi:hypothetical protein
MLKEGLTLGTKEKITLGKSKLYGDFMVRYCDDSILLSALADISDVSDSLQSRIKAAIVEEIGHETEILDLTLYVDVDNPDVTENDGDKRIRDGIKFKTEVWIYIYDDVKDISGTINIPIDLTGFETELKEIVLEGVKEYLDIE